MLAALLLGCRRDEVFTEDPSAKLEFAADTVYFDTVFTTVHTITKRFTVHNRNTNALRFSVALAGGSPSPFRFNVDGRTGLQVDDVEVLGKDSLFVFVEATLDANSGSHPMVVEDELLFRVNGNLQQVLLVAWGQDVQVYRPPVGSSLSIIAGGEDANGNPICETVRWTADKPYLIYGSAAVDTCAKLIVDPGVRVFFHGGSRLWIYKYGTIEARGTVEQPITFQGDRLEPMYADLPGQWDRIWVWENDQDNVFENCIIKNSLVGIQCETDPTAPSTPMGSGRLVLENVQIRNSSAVGLLSRNYRIKATNLLVGNSGQYCVLLTGDGQYDFNHVTMANYWSHDIRQDPAFYLSNAAVMAPNLVRVGDILPSTFRNGISHGSLPNEFLMEIDNRGTAQLQFDHWLFRTDRPTSDPQYFQSGTIYRNQTPGFVSASEGDLRITAGAYVRNKGIYTPDLFDIRGVLRADGQPDLGCYEYSE